ncbi:kinetochore Sim4 complex subunit FTA2-domain-containing protein [Xylariaceae sp. FL0662B]|nr:kinetochore Sim4 complex subunit FTA2-domain-containing protein [Xylariaceae sp. FL0662B]
MYPDWPESDADLVPLPRCDGPKLKPFDFQGPQKIEFLEHLGEGLHARVFKEKILEQIYALKLFRFVFDYNWQGPASDTNPDSRKLMSAFYDYSEPFSCKCRAFGHKEHEKAIMTQFSDLDLSFDGDINYPGSDKMRIRFLGKGNRAPPIREILGIINVDVATRQIIDDRLGDFSTAITTPHFLTTPELNPHLTPEMISAMELETFKVSINDYLAFDGIMFDWNLEHEDQDRSISVTAFPGGSGCQLQYNLRSRKVRERVYTFVDPRKYDWKTRHASAGTGGAETAKRQRSERIEKGARNGNLRVASSGIRRRLRSRPPVWWYNCDDQLAERLRTPYPLCPLLQWDYKEGFIFPRVKEVEE